MTPPKGQRGERTVTVLDVGTSKVAALIALVGAGEPRVIGVGQRVCHGVRSADRDEQARAQGRVFCAESHRTFRLL